jgi:hypothetical protein
MKYSRFGLAVAAAILMVPAMVWGEGRGTEVTFQVSAYVVPRVLGTVEVQFDRFQVTAADLARGYVELPAAVRIDVKTNDPNGFLISYENLAPELVSSVELDSGAEKISLSSSQGWVHRPFTATHLSESWTLRLYLAPQASVGEYALPLAFALQVR